jgi:hypothetical protein
LIFSFTGGNIPCSYLFPGRKREKATANLYKISPCWIIFAYWFLSHDFIPYDPADKPALLYEVLLFSFASGLAIFIKIVSSFSMGETFWRPLRLIALIIIVFTLLILLFHLLVPPKFTASRLAQVIILLIWLRMVTNI